MNAELLSIYDDQLRITAEVSSSRSISRVGPLYLGVYPNRGSITYRDLDGHTGTALDALIQRAVSFFAEQTELAFFEWKTRGHDAPADLGDRLRSAGLVPDPVETVMFGEAAALAVDVPLPEGVRVHRIEDLADPALDGAVALQDAVFGRGGPSAAGVRDRLRDQDNEFWVAVADGRVVTAGRLEPVTETQCAGLWGGVTDPDWRGRGLYRALVAARARSALAKGYRFLYSDCTDMSRPILQRSGLVAITTTTPYLWTRPD